MIKKEVYRSLGLKDDEYSKIRGILGRDPTPTELAMFSVEWSEHCGYPRSRNLLRLLPKTGRYEVLIGEDSGGIIVDNLAIIFKMESHNHPSQIEPKQGAATGVGGIIRDIFTAGARPIALLNSLRFGPLSEPYNRYLLRGVVDGIQFYGNCLGVPTVGGEIYFDESYNGNCIVNAMSIGITDRKGLARARAFGVGNSIMYVGSSTGKDGIGGCSVLASQEFREGEEKRPAVQIGDPFTEKCLIEATMEALKTGYVLGIKDMGAAGLTCSTAEMAAAGNSGIEIDIKDVPRREENMQPWEVMMSESQERMLVCVKKGREKEISKIFSKWDLNGVVIGKVIGEELVRIKDNGKVVAQVSPQALANGPIYNMPHRKPDYLDKVNELDLKSIAEPKDYNKALSMLMASPSISDKSWVYEQYDHMVQTNTMVLPGSDAAVIRIKGTDKAIAATTDCNSRYCFLNPYRGAKIAVLEAARNIVCSGGEPVAVTDCLNFGNPEKEDRFWQFKNCVEGIAHICKHLNIAVVSGNVSFYNESPNGAINPTPTIGMIGIINNVENVCTQYFKNNNDAIILLGVNKQELGGSEYLKVMHDMVKGDAPDLDIDMEIAVQQAALEAITKGLVNSAHDCSEGGLAVTLAESCISGDKLIGADVELEDKIRKDTLLFGESQSRIILSCDKKNVAKIKQIAEKNKAAFVVLGTTGGGNLAISVKNEKVIDADLIKLKKTWKNSIKEALGFVA
ncbi:MAG: phosphoribosylformylglycinamidine synthase subunit PurL [Candidatus Omnitrophota bacterium]